MSEGKVRRYGFVLDEFDCQTLVESNSPFPDKVMVLASDYDTLRTCYDGLLETGNKILAERDQLAAEAERLKAVLANSFCDLRQEVLTLTAQLDQSQADARLTMASPCADGGKYKRHDWEWDKKRGVYFCCNCRLYRKSQPDLLVTVEAIDSALSNQRGEKA